MSIRLNRKKLLCISFFLCCVLPSSFSWFAAEKTQWSGMSMIELPLLISTSMFAFALLFERARYMLPLGIASHLLLVAFSANCLFSFAVIAGLSDARDWALSLSSARPLYWVGVGLQLFHLALFTTTEIAMQRLTRQLPTAEQQVSKA